MYFPYLKGRQYELLAIRELLSKNLLSKKIIPIIEPVKVSSTLLSTLETASSLKRKIAVICNSNITMGFNMNNTSEEDKEYLKILKNKNIIKVFFLYKNLEKTLKVYQDNEIFEDVSEIMIICDNADYVEEYQKNFTNKKPKYTLIPNENRFKRNIKENIILLDDKFEKKERNSDYLLNEDEFFSDDHLYYKEDDYKGFSDYSIIGKKFIDGGFAPYAVVIHMLYFDDKKNLRVHHFVSDSNYDIKDPANKFYEALKKLIKFNEKKSLGETKAMEKLRNYYTHGDYPGLGSIKKISLSHHLELIGRFLDEEER
ncbi:sce7725 family protein [Fusobacterium animalis]|uniref:sce7725 family protein n=1 Tax=Fusobacterium animalis TaxID=76859 RepID=UPI0030D42711